MKRAGWCGVALAILAATGGAAMAGESERRLQELVDGLPDQVEGWRRGDAEFYGPDDLYRYINGGAELFIAYQFTSVVSQPYVDVNDDEIRLDVFDMGAPSSAFGVFSHSRESVDRFVAPDAESEYAGGLLHFWKGRYYGSALAYPETETKKAMIRELARRITDRIEGDCRWPDVVAILPVTDLVPDSIRYFRHRAWINDFHHFADENLLNIGADTEVAMARVRTEAGEAPPAVLVAIRYPSAATAAEATAQFTQALLPGTADGLRQESDDTWLGCLHSDDIVVIVAEAPDRKTAKGLLEACERSRDHVRRGGHDDE